MTPLSVFITTFNNERTLATCLERVQWADDIVVVDSFSDDHTIAIAQRYDCNIFQHEFLGYGKQKALAMSKTRNRWVLLLDADEALSVESEQEIVRLMEAGPQADGYELARREQVFWQMASNHVRRNYYLRLFDKNKAQIDDMPVHAAPKVQGTIERLTHPFLHFGETDVHTKVEKINHYSSGLVVHKQQQGRRANPLKMVFLPPWYFIRSFVFKRGFLNGWAGFIASATIAFYAFLRYAKLYEKTRAREPMLTLNESSGDVHKARVEHHQGHRDRY